MDWNPGTATEVEDSIFAIMSRLCLVHQAVNLGQGFPDFDGPDWVKEVACQAIMEKPNQYAPMAGIQSLRRAVAEKYKTHYGLDYCPDQEITITNGASQAIYLSLSSLCGPGDEVIIFEPAYDIYAPIIRRAGAIPVGVPLTPPTFCFSGEKFKEAVNEKTRIIVINSPHNPTGTVFTRKDLEQIRDVCLAHDLIAITDEVYEHLIFEGEHIALASLKGMRERTVTISSTAKTFSMTGWKIGYVLAPLEASDLMRKLHQLVCFCVAKPLQHGMVMGIDNWQMAVKPLHQTLALNRDILVKGLRSCGFKVLPPDGTFFLVADFKELSTKNDRDFACELIQRKDGVGTIPVSSFYVDPGTAPQNYLRFCFAKKKETLEMGLERLKKVLRR